MGFISANVGRLMGSTSTALAGAQALLAGETQGLAFDFTDQSAYIVDTGTPANNYDSTGIVSSGSLVGPSGKLTYTSPSNKLTLQADGYYKYQAHNLCLQSETFDTTWSPASNLVVTSETGQGYPSGTSAAWKLTDQNTGTHRIQQNITVVAGASYRFSVFLKYGDLQWAGIWITDNAATDQAFYPVDVLNKVAGTPFYVANGATITEGFTVTDVGGGWVQAIVDFKAAPALSEGSYTPLFFIGLHSDETTISYTASGNFVYATGAHLYRTPAVTDYIKTTTAAVYSLPYEYDTSGNCEGLLVEEARTNKVTYSQDFTTGWGTFSNGTGSVSRLADQGTSPSGTTTADLITINRSDTSSYAQVRFVLTGTAATHAGSIYIKAYAAGDIGKTFDLYLYNATAIVGCVEVTLTSEWQRVSTTGTLAAAAGCQIGFGYNDTGGGGVSTQTGSTQFLVWGAQLEAGSFPTSLVQTFGSSATRAADNISIATSAFPYSGTSGTLYVRFSKWLASASDFGGLSTDINNRLTLYHNAGDPTLRMFMNNGGAAQTNTDIGEMTANVTGSAAFAWATNDLAASLNGATVVTDTLATVPTGLTVLNVALNFAGGAQLNGHLKQLSFVPRRKSNAELQAETA